MACSCTSGLGNTGLPSCLPTNEIPVGFLFQQTYDSTGTKNFLDGTTIDTANYLIGLTQNADTTKRLYPVQDIAEAVSERGDSTFYTDSLGVNYFIKEGERTYVGEKLVGASPLLVGKIGAFKCVQMSVYVIGHEGGIFGSSTENGKLYGYEIVTGSMDVKWVTMTSSKPAHIPMTFTLADTVVDSEIMKFDSSEIEDNAKELSGLKEIKNTTSGISTTTVTQTLTLEYGSAKTLTKVEGLVAADFTMAEVSPTPASITITSVTESSAGVYDFVFPLETAADVLSINLSATGIAKGYNLEEIQFTVA